MIIRNKDLLATNPLREKALSILEFGLAAIDTSSVIKKSVRVKDDFLFVQNKIYDLSKYRRILLLAFGKVAYPASLTLKEILREKLKGGVVLSLSNKKIEGLETYQCTHPDPSVNNVEATKRAIGFLKSTTEDDLVLLVISGGGSAMLTSPYKISYEEKAIIAKTLMNSGANIEELNIVRKHLSEIKGGRLAELTFPSTLVTFIFSDVVGNDLSTIASGPTVLDHTTSGMAEKIIEKFDIYKKTGLGKLDFNETPKNPKFFSRVDNFLLLDNTTATAALEEKARSLNYSTRIFANDLRGEASKVGEEFLKEARKKEVLIAAGETTVKVVGSGVGGRNQELVLANLEKIKDNQVLISCASDGYDHSEAAGAIGDKYTLKKASESGAEIKKYLQTNDSYHFFEKVGDGIETGQLESNVADLMMVVTDFAERG